ncbi:phosphate ABC transporter permease PstA [Thiocystis violascens]|uniref:Phosphate transport system permease protein PstA n=1 Tax=Thiocystis violascens (strain ATCC 17096 / DSM 198 / 6111) TaxID=765911 RepID=I3YD59_THIV6|nr:phosphate ABC transporter permease PstA [Thiocystis violascens]AFL74927.1 phosphate ABC transporter membrane protein 2, PhoT family [Thiocystis violascens DSM 198]
MSNPAAILPGVQPRRTIDIVNASLKRRYARERRFRLIGAIAVGLGLAFVVLLFADIVSKGYTAFQQTYIRLPVTLTASVIDPAGTRDMESIAGANYSKLIRDALRQQFPEVTDRSELRRLYSILSVGAPQLLQERVMEDPSLIGTSQEIWVLADDDIDMLVKGNIDRDAAQGDRRVTDEAIGWVGQLEQQGRIEKRFNTIFFTHGTSREPELAGIAGALMGSFYTLTLALALSFPIGVGAALYLEEFAPKNRWTDLIEVNINNLAAVPSIVFGLLGLAVFIGFFGVPRSTPLVAAMVLTLMTLPIIIISSRAALKSVPPSIREAALGVGASPLQTQFHHVLPLAMPGMLTGTILGMAHALGETAPLLMIGMIAFIVDVPSGFTDSATVLPVQIFLWADSPERGFVERTSAAIMVLLAFLFLMNFVAVMLRRKFERRW